MVRGSISSTLLATNTVPDLDIHLTTLPARLGLHYKRDTGETR